MCQTLFSGLYTLCPGSGPAGTLPNKHYYLLDLMDDTEAEGLRVTVVSVSGSLALDLGLCHGSALFLVPDSLSALLWCPSLIAVTLCSPEDRAASRHRGGSPLWPRHGDGNLGVEFSGT